MKRILLTSAALALLSTIGIAQAGGDAAAGKAEDQFIQAMKDYKSGKRPNPVMKSFAGPLSDQDFENLAAYYASLKKK